MGRDPGFIYGQIQGEGSGKVDITFGISGANDTSSAGVGVGVGSSSLPIQPLTQNT